MSRSRLPRTKKARLQLQILEDRQTPAVITVTTANDELTPNNGKVSLREAITAINAGNDLGDPDIAGQNPGTFGMNDAIHFNIPGTPGILVTSALPTIARPVTIDGYTQPGASANTLAVGDDAVIKVEVGGLNVNGVNGLTISGGGTTVRGLKIDGFQQSGGVGGNAIFLTSTAGNVNNVIAGNFIGTGFENGTAGVNVQGAAQNTRVGGVDPADRNVISHNKLGGVFLSGDSNLVEGNYIGTNAQGTATADVGGTEPQGFGLLVEGNNNTVGGTAAAGNLISGNTVNGVDVETGVTGNRIQGNFIGTDATGTKAVANGANGIILNVGAADTRIEGNLISGNTTDGIVLLDGATGTVIRNNRIGTDASGTSALGNALNGVEFAFLAGNPSASNNTVGGTGPGQGNVIAFNGGAGVFVATGTGDTVWGNSIFSNGDLGIDLLPNGPTPNDSGDADVGANNRQNFPVVASAVESLGVTTVKGTLNSVAGHNYRIEIFASSSADPSGFGEGETLLGAVQVTTDAGGNASFSFPTSQALPATAFITATATDLGTQDTSEFSAAVRAVPAVGGQVSGTAFDDRNGNGARDAGEPGLGGVIVFLDLNGNGVLDSEPSTVTAADGSYTLTSSADGSFAVRQVLPSGFRQTTGSPAPVKLVNGSNTAGVDFGDSANGAGAAGAGTGKAFAVGADAGGDSVRVFNPDGSERFSVRPFPGLAGGVRTATADVNRDGTEDLIAGTGPGAPTLVKVLDGKSGDVLLTVAPFETSFTGGVFVAAADLNGDGFADFVVTPDEGGGPRVRIFDGKTGNAIADFFGIEDLNFRGGARAALADVNGDGTPDLLVAAGFGGGPRIAVFDGKSLASGSPQKLVGDFFVFEQTLRNGVFIAGGDLNGDGFADVVAGGGPGGGPRVFALSGKDLLGGNQTQVANFFGGDPAGTGGIRVAAKNLDGDNRADLVVGDGQGAGSRVTEYAGRAIPADGTPPELNAFDALPGFAGGVFVG